MGEFRIFGKISDKHGRGDLKKQWDPDNDEEVKAAKDEFDRLKKKKFKAYRVDKKGDKGKEIYNFEREAGRIIMVPPIAGG